VEGCYPSPANPRPTAGGFVKVEAFAKINLFLDVLGKRQDGYHNIVSVMQSVSLCDELTIEYLPQGSGVHLSCNVAELSTGKDNLISQAATALISEFEIPGGFRIELAKQIPLGGGLAGGSSDCAATLRGINALCELNIPHERLLEIGTQLGADVPFCLTGGTALTEGIGEKITPLAPHPPCYIIIVCPNIHVSTREIFSRLGTTKSNPSARSILDAISQKNLHKISSSLYNIFTPVTTNLHPEISAIIEKLRTLGALGAEMSGTGSSVFAYFNDEKSALAALDIMKSSNNAYLCEPRGFAPHPTRFLKKM
jgi:4-diphosphocytidyl-2-C-methyl-D-erythritol kinase